MSGLTCTYAVPKKKGPKSKKAKVASERRKTQQETGTGSLSEAYNASSSPELQHLHEVRKYAEYQMKDHLLHSELDKTMCAISLNP